MTPGKIERDMPNLDPGWRSRIVEAINRHRDNFLAILARKVFRRLFQALSPLFGAHFVSAQVGPYRLAFDLRDAYQGYMLFQIYERDTEAFYQTILRPGDTYVDIGAQIGYMAAQAAKAIGPSGTMVLFEPDPRAIPRLEQTLLSAIAGTAPRHFLWKVACSDQSGTVEFELHDTLGWSYVVDDTNAGGGARRQSVACDRAENLLAQSGVSGARLLKIDVEGHEVDVLRGLYSMLEARCFDFINIEKNITRLEANGFWPEHLHALIAKCGYLGFTEDGQPISLEGMRNSWLEPYVYAASAELAKLIARPASVKEAIAAASSDFEPLFSEAYRPESWEKEARKIIVRVRDGDLAGGIVDGEQLLESHADLTSFRGHLAHWHTVAGNSSRARHHLQLLVKAEPENHEALRLLECLPRSSF